MTGRQWLMRAHNLILGTDKFSLSNHSLRPSFVSIVNLDFFKWITGKYGIFGKWRTRFPTLFFPLRRRIPFLDCLLLTNATIFPRSRSYHQSQNSRFSINLSPRISLAVTEDREPSHKAPHGIPPNRVLVRSNSSFSHPEIHLLNHKSSSTPITQPIFSKTSNMLIAAGSERPGRSRSEMVPPFIKIAQGNERFHLLSKSKSWTVGHKLTDAKESKIIPSETESARFHQSVPVAPNVDFTSQKSEIGTERYYHAASYQQPLMGGVGHPVSRSSTLALQHLNPLHIESYKQPRTGGVAHPVSGNSTPTLHYLNPLRAAEEHLQKSAASTRGKVAEAERNIDKSGADNFAVGRRVSDITHKTNINLNHLTDQVYQMLERKIRIERERRGL